MCSSFCSGLPNRANVAPRMLMETPKFRPGMSYPVASSKNTRSCSSVRPCPPYSLEKVNPA